VTISQSPNLDASAAIVLPPVNLTETKPPEIPMPSFAPILDNRPMDRTDRRLVFSRLNELYVDEKTGYSADWTDAKVAQDLGVPVDWIAEVREADFGPELNASIRAKSFTDLQKLGESIERHILLIDKKIEQMQSLDAKITDAMKACNEAIDRFEELSKSLESEDKRVEDLLDAFNKDVIEFKKMFADLAGLASPK
jgi:chromosome segregation ATPase